MRNATQAHTLLRPTSAILLAATLTLAACSTDDTTMPTGTPAAAGIGVISGSAQFAPISTTAPAPLVVRVTDQFGKSIAGVTVQFTATGGATLSAASAVTDTAGLASTTLSFTSHAGLDSVVASVAGVTTPATFIENAQAGPVSTFVILQGNAQTGTTGIVLPTTLAVQAKDSFGNLAVGDTVTFTATGGTIAMPFVVTDQTGTAQIPFTPALGANTVTAVVQGMTVVFTETGS